MRLQEIHYISQNALDSWEDLQLVKNPNGRGYVIGNESTVLHKMNELGTVPLFSDLCSKIIRSFQSDIYHKEDCKELESLYGKLKSMLAIICELCEFLNLPTHQGDCNISNDRNPVYRSFDIKLPPNLSLAELSKCMGELDKAFIHCPLFLDNDATISFNAVDVGSFWLSFTVTGFATIAIMKGIAELVDSAIRIRANILALNEQKLRARQAGMTADAIEAATHAYGNIVKFTIQTEAKQLASAHNISDNESKERIRYCLDILSEWMSKGLEIYAGIGEPTEMVELFPSKEKQELPDAAKELLDAFVKD